ncbi:MAG TPA: polysaccharide deacetylase family protein [Labilithrix sp.]|nr:polysaccharide deacetylase family protein [Labilithrix sp.]
MFRAMVVKVAAAALVALELWLLPAGVRGALAIVTVLGTMAFFAYVIVAPWSQFLVESVCRLPRELAKDRAIAFTFDDGPDPVTTPQVLDLLARHGAKATFFVVGSRVAEHPDLVRRIVAEGHAVGSHTYHHSHAFHFLGPSRMREEVRRGIEAVAAVTGAPPKLFRPPQGLRTPLLRDALRPLRDLVCVTWTERGLDAMGRRSAAIVGRLEHAVQPSAILTLHDGAGLGGTLDRQPTVEALERLLVLAAERDLRCVSLAELESAA